MCYHISFIFSFGFQITNFVADAGTLFQFYIESNYYFFYAFIISLLINTVFTFIVGSYTYSKLENNLESETYLRTHFILILIFMTIFPPFNLYVFFTIDKNVYQIGVFLSRLLDIFRTVSVTFLSIYLNIYLFFDNRDNVNDFRVACLLLSILFASKNILDVHIFTYSNRIRAFLYDEVDSQKKNMMEEINKYQSSEEYKFYHMILIYIIFITDFFGFSILWGIYSQVIPRYCWIILVTLFFTCTLYTILSLFYYSCIKCLSDSEEKEIIFSFSFIDNFFSVFCLPFGPLSLSKIYYFLKVFLAFAYLIFSGYLLYFNSTDLKNILNNYFKRYLFYSALVCLLFFIFFYPFFLLLFKNLKKKNIEDFKIRRKSKNDVVSENESVKIIVNDRM